ncbi:DUF6992 family protein [Archangium lipolyticum]|uniref:DUF6992 family protein n=1 Tax=Archangium lipolyticum TaxID=2970465 RepID=UPI00214A4EA2|nr:hypothetical protein [Archangium lipolyticum]
MRSFRLRPLLAFLVVLLCSMAVPARAAPEAPVASEDSAFRVPGGSPERERFLRDLNAERIEMNRTAVWLLTGWTVLNLAVGTVVYFTAEDPVWRGFHQMNALFNVPVLGAALGSFALLAAQDPERLDLRQSLFRGGLLERGLLVGITLDVASGLLGLYLRERGLRVGSERLEGWGHALLLQGAFLLLFDTSLLVMNIRHQARLLPLVDPSGRGGGVAFVVRL